MSTNLAVNLKMVRNILALVQIIFINRIIYYIIVSIYRNLWVILILFAISAIRQVCSPYSHVILHVSSYPHSTNQTPAIMPAIPPIKKNGKICAVCEVSCKLKCKWCKRVYYCCREHQVSDWKEHKKSCNVVSVINQ